MMHALYLQLKQVTYHKLLSNDESNSLTTLVHCIDLIKLMYQKTNFNVHVSTYISYI